MTELARKHCVPCRGGVPALTREEIRPLLAQIPGWKVIEDHHLQQGYKFPDFQSALDFVNRVGEIAEREDHHPDIHLTWGQVDLTVWTHKIDGLTESDFILAAKIEEAYRAAEAPR